MKWLLRIGLIGLLITGLWLGISLLLPQSEPELEVSTPTILPAIPTNYAERSPDQFLAADSSSFSRIEDSFYVDEYQLFQCLRGDYDLNAVALSARDANFEDVLPEAIKDAVLDWEPYILQDIGTKIYPNVAVEEFDQTIRFTDTRYYKVRQADFFLAGEPAVLYLIEHSNFLIIAPTAACGDELFEEYAFGHGAEGLDDLLDE